MKNIKVIIILFIVVIVGYIILSYTYGNLIPKDKFDNIVLNNISSMDIVDSDQLNKYNCYFNDKTNENLIIGANIANKNYNENSAKIALKFNELSAKIDNLMVQLNNDILNNISENYGRAHLLNKQREIMKRQLYDLPLKNI